ncbi:MAG: hypothetical protein II916_00615 [Oscillospiraceae bacterium]|nr:hypothetical protein [Oscillospiraceae bacterium]
MWDFIKDNILTIFCVLGLIWLGNLFLTQLRYKKQGARLEGTVVGHVNQSGNYFPVYEFNYNGETLRVDSYNGDKNPMIEGETEIIYYLPGNQKGVFAERNMGVKPWQILCGAAFIVVIVISLMKFFTK